MIIRPEIKGEPIATLFLSFLEHQDYDNVYFFSRMNLATALSQFVFTLVSPSVINIAYLNNKRVYYLDINVEINKAQEAIQRVDMCTFAVSDTAFRELYKFILEHYTAIDNKPETNKIAQLNLFRKANIGLLWNQFRELFLQNLLTLTLRHSL